MRVKTRERERLQKINSMNYVRIQISLFLKYRFSELLQFKYVNELLLTIFLLFFNVAIIMCFTSLLIAYLATKINSNGRINYFLV